MRVITAYAVARRYATVVNIGYLIHVRRVARRKMSAQQKQSSASRAMEAGIAIMENGQKGVQIAQTLHDLACRLNSKSKLSEDERLEIASELSSMSEDIKAAALSTTANIKVVAKACNLTYLSYAGKRRQSELSLEARQVERRKKCKKAPAEIPENLPGVLSQLPKPDKETGECDKLMLLNHLLSLSPGDRSTSIDFAIDHGWIPIVNRRSVNSLVRKLQQGKPISAEWGQQGNVALLTRREVKSEVEDYLRFHPGKTMDLDDVIEILKKNAAKKYTLRGIVPTEEQLTVLNRMAPRYLHILEAERAKLSAISDSPDS